MEVPLPTPILITRASNLAASCGDGGKDSTSGSLGQILHSVTCALCISALGTQHLVSTGGSTHIVRLGRKHPNIVGSCSGASALNRPFHHCRLLNPGVEFPGNIRASCDHVSIVLISLLKKLV